MHLTEKHTKEYTEAKTKTIRIITISKRINFIYLEETLPYRNMLSFLLETKKE